MLFIASGYCNLGRCPREEVGHRHVDGGHEELAAHHPLPRQSHREHPPLPEQQINESSLFFKVARTKEEGKRRGFVRFRAFFTGRFRHAFVLRE